MAPEFYTTKVIMLDLQKCCSDEHLSITPWCFLLYLANFHLQITYRKVTNLQIGADKLFYYVTQSHPLA